MDGFERNRWPNSQARTGPTVVLLACLAFLFTAPPLAAEEGPAACPRRGLPCATAAAAVARVIEDDAGLARLAAEIEQYMAALLARLDPAAADALRRDHAVHVTARSRDLAISPAGVSPESRAVLRDHLERRLAFLRRLDPDAPPGLLGEWQGYAGEVRVRPADDGSPHVTANSVEPFNLGWTCELAAAARAEGPNLVIDPAPALPGHRLRRDGAVLRMERLDDGGERNDWCGAGGTLSGVLFRMRDAGR